MGLPKGNDLTSLSGLKDHWTANALPMHIIDNPHAPGFMFQQYRSVDENSVAAYEALAKLKNKDGTPLANVDFFDELRGASEEWQITVDRFLVPLAIQAAAEKNKLPVAINVHICSLIDDIFQQIVQEAMSKAGVDKKDIWFEIVEPHVPTDAQIIKLKNLSKRTNPDSGFALIIDDHDFEKGEDRLRRLAPFCDIVKFDMDKAEIGYEFFKTHYPHLKIVIERVTFNDRDTAFAKYPGVLVQGI